MAFIYSVGRLCCVGLRLGVSARLGGIQSIHGYGAGLSEWRESGGLDDVLFIRLCTQLSMDSGEVRVESMDKRTMDNECKPWIPDSMRGTGTPRYYKPRFKK